MKQVMLLLVLAILLVGCSQAPTPTPVVVYVEVTATPAPTVVPTPTVVPRVTEDGECDANWYHIVKGGDRELDPDVARSALASVVDGTVAVLPGSVGAYLKACVAEGWLGFWDDEPSLFPSLDG